MIGPDLFPFLLDVINLCSLNETPGLPNKGVVALSSSLQKYFIFSKNRELIYSYRELPYVPLTYSFKAILQVWIFKALYD